MLGSGGCAGLRQIWKFRYHFHVWAVLSTIFIAIVLIPNVLIGVHFFTETNENWAHIQQYLLKNYIYSTTVIALFTALAAMLIGTSLAWLVTVYRFPLRDFLRWGLILPLAIPPYIGAYAYHGLLNYTGIIQSTLRNSFDIYIHPQYLNIMNIPGAVFIFTLFLFPYVYTITKSFYENQSASVIENARLLRGNSKTIFFRVALPISRTAIVGGVVLVVLEVLNDYGVAHYFGIQTFSTAIFRTWHGMRDLDSALKLAGALMLFVIVVLVLERLLRGSKRYEYATAQVRPVQPIPLQGGRKWLVFAYCFGVFIVAFIVPLLQLAQWLLLTYRNIWSGEFFTLVYNSVTVAAVASLIIVVIALVIANFTRLNRGWTAKIFSRATTLGYSVPGAAIAIAVLTLFMIIDGQAARIAAALGLDGGIVLRTTLMMLVFAYMIRFLAVGFNTIESGFEKVGSSFTEASRALGWSTVQSFFKVDLPMLKGTVFSAFILVFVDILKELPLTLFLQPFNFSTLATQAYRYANDEMVQEAALASLLIILISAMCIYFFHKVLESSSSKWK